MTTPHAPPQTTDAPRPPGANGQGQPHAHAQPHADDLLPTDLPKPGNWTVLIVAVVFVALMAGLFVVGWLPHHAQEEQTAGDAQAMADTKPMVGVTRPKAAPAVHVVSLPANITPWQETAIYPRSSGYMKTLLHDIGDKVNAGELLAEIDTPEVDAQLDQAKASLAQAQANVIKAQADVDLAQRTLKRYDDAQKESPGSVTVQQLDERRSALEDDVAALAQNRASVLQADATVKQLTVLQSFEKVVAPFEGVITARNYDVGAYVSVNNPTATRDMFRISNTRTLRVFINMPQTYAANVKIGQPATLTLRNYAGRDYTGTVARTAGQLDTSTRTLRVEIDFPNPDGTLFPGMYGQVSLRIADPKPVLLVPTSALVFNASGLRVGVVRDNHIHLQEIGVGRDMGTEIEVTSGLSAADDVVTNPGLHMAEGVEVQVFKPEGNAAVARTRHAASVGREAAK